MAGSDKAGLAFDATQDRSLPASPAFATTLPPAGPGEGPAAELACRYELVGLLGRGGMGEVHEARDLLLGRPVALKFLLGAGNERSLRLLQEARAQARLEHPNLCKVYEVGELGGKPFIAMQLVRGRPLGEAAAEMTLPEKVQAMKRVAEAMHEAHRLGVVHRDLKPSNILLGRAEDGTWQPTVMDFGLAYEMQRGHGLTGTWALMGTPAYMAPEQARGEVRSIDRRSDVYGLGATLYELLTGQPPFAAATPAATVHQVLHDEPRPPRALVPHLPADLETVTLKCLHKDPDRRYPTARALADDLGRYLEGEPIVGRRPGLAERLGRWGRKHRPLVAVSALALSVTLGVAGWGTRSWLGERRARAEAAERERLGQELGQQAKEVEWFLHAAHALPLHDTTRERAYVRERMREIAARGRQAGALGAGLAHYALGRGHLALGEYEPAYDELSLAARQGVDSPELSYALGRALGELYRRAAEAARRGGGREWAAARQKAAEAQYLAPALAALERSRGHRAESPLYLESLIALYRRDYAAAARAAERAIAETPWAYEARKVSGDAASARATERLERGEYDAARASFDEAAALYGRALEFGRSDAATYEALAAVWLERSEIDRRQGGPRRQSLERALAAANQAVEADPGRASARTRRAYVLMNRYKLRRLEAARDDELGPDLDDWLREAKRAVELDPNDPYAYDVLGNGYALGALQDARAGRDPTRSWGEAARWLGRALELDPEYPRGLNDLAAVYRSMGGYLVDRAHDPRGAYAESERLLRAAIRSDPASLFAYANLSDIHTSLALYEVSHGRDPELDVDRALEWAEQALALDPRYFASLNQAALAELVRAEYLAGRGDDPRPAVARALRFVDRSLAVNAASGKAPLLRARCHYLAAQHALRAGDDPGAPLDAARGALAEAYRRDATCSDCRVLGAMLYQLEATRAGRQGRDVVPALRRALAEATAALAIHPSYVEAHQELARALLRLAEALPPGASSGPIGEGLAHAERALALAPGMASARAVRGALLLARARTARDAATSREAARLAAIELERALELNPLLRADHDELVRAAKALAATTAPDSAGR
ncbi:MAG TPA: protein kinase [Polyangiaceae bacterium]|nr:protein kinase [Polyangiaceae bacterium]